MSQPATAKIPFGGDDNPEQWPREVWDQDHRLFDAARVDTVTLGVFDWALIQPAPDVYDFGTDRLTGLRVAAGDPVKIEARGVLLLREED